MSSRNQSSVRPPQRFPQMARHSVGVQGRAHINENHAYQKWDFLKDENHEKFVTEKNSSPNTLDTRFSRGFFRRKLDPQQSRDPKIVEIQERKAMQTLKASQARQEAIAHRNNRNGNIIIGGEAITQKCHATGIRLLPSKSDGIKREEDLLNRTSETRFFYPANKQTNRSDAPKYVCKTSSIGYHKGDIPSHGVADNFMGQGY